MESAVVYCRVSTKEQADNLSLLTQETRCIEYCSRNSWPVDKVFRDAGESAKTSDRPAFQQMLAYCRANRSRICYVVVHDLSRFSRNTLDHVQVLVQLRARGINLRSVQENIDETPAGNLVRGITSIVAEYENNVKAERTKLGMQRAAEMGRWPFVAPLGYRNVSNRHGPNIIPDPTTAPLVKKAFELYAGGTQSGSQVLRTVTTLGLRSIKGKPLATQTFQSLLRNQIYAGWVEIPKWNLRARGNFEPLVRQELFNRVQDLRNGKRLSATPHSRNNPVFPLRVFIRCQICSQPFTGSPSKGRKKYYCYYRCRNSKCKSGNIRTERLEKEFAALVERLKPSGKYMKVFKEVVRRVWKQKQADAENSIKAVTQRLKALQERKDRLVDAILEKRIDKKTYDEQVERLNTKVEEAQREFQDNELECMEVEAVLEFADKLLENPSRLWLQAPLDQKQRLQKVFFPGGLAYSKEEGFGTAVTSPLFNLLEEYSGGKSSVVSPAGFEPRVSPEEAGAS